MPQVFGMWLFGVRQNDTRVKRIPVGIRRQGDLNFGPQHFCEPALQ